MNNPTTTNKIHTLTSIEVSLIGILVALLLSGVDAVVLPVPGGTMKNIFIFILVAITSTQWLNLKVRKLHYAFMVLIVFYIGMKLYHIFYLKMFYYDAFQYILNLILYTILLLSLASCKLTKKDYVNLVISSGYTFCITTLVTFVLDPQTCFYDSRLYGCGMDPNDFALHMLCIFYGLLWVLPLLEKGRLVTRVLCYIPCGVMLVFLILSGSRGGMLGLLISILYWFLYSRTKIFRKIYVCLLVVVIILGAREITLQNASTEWGDMLLTRLNFTEIELNESGMDELSTGRTMLWEAYFRAIQEKPITGYFSELHVPYYIPISSISGLAYVPHNCVLTYFVFGGFFTGVQFLILVIMILVDSIKFENSKKLSHIYSAGFVGFFAVAQFLSTPLEICILVLLFLYYQNKDIISELSDSNE